MTIDDVEGAGFLDLSPVAIGTGEKIVWVTVNDPSGLVTGVWVPYAKLREAVDEIGGE